MRRGGSGAMRTTMPPFLLYLIEFESIKKFSYFLKAFFNLLGATCTVNFTKILFTKLVYLIKVCLPYKIVLGR